MFCAYGNQMSCGQGPAYGVEEHELGHCSSEINIIATPSRRTRKWTPSSKDCDWELSAERSRPCAFVTPVRAGKHGGTPLSGSEANVPSKRPPSPFSLLTRLRAQPPPETEYSHMQCHGWGVVSQGSPCTYTADSPASPCHFTGAGETRGSPWQNVAESQGSPWQNVAESQGSPW